MTDQEFCLLTQDPYVFGLLSGDDEWGAGMGTWYYLWTRTGGREPGFRGKPADTIDERRAWVEVNVQLTKEDTAPWLRLDEYLRKFRERRRGRR